jgi:Na+/H+ antiporter NhaC
VVLAGSTRWGTAGALDFLLEALIDPDHMAIIVFSLLLGGMVGVMARSGGTQGIVEKLERRHQPHPGQFLTWFSAVFIFFDDYANTLIRGNALRPMTDRQKISREKLAYIVDSTAAPLAVSAVITTWIGFQITQVRDSMATLAERPPIRRRRPSSRPGPTTPSSSCSTPIPYLFYPILALVFVLMIVVMKRDFGPMYRAERRAYPGEA